MSETSSLTVADALPDDVPTLQGMLKAERMRNADLTGRLATSVPMMLSYQPFAVGPPPLSKEQLWAQACSNDGVTSQSWKKTWLENIERNVKENGADESQVGDDHLKNWLKPCICVASGPSLKKNIDVLKTVPPEIPIISCLHSYGALVDRGIKATYLTLDAGSVVLPEMTEGGTNPDKDFYLEASKDCTLIAGLVSPPDIVKHWKGKIKWFNATIPDAEFMEKMPKITKNRWVYSVGGNTFGACMYHAAWIWGCNPLALVGADYAFDYMHKFHSWSSAYDSQFAGLVPCVDVFGNRVYSWPSYQNFRAWTEFQCQGGQSNHNVRIVNCTEGGTLGAYPHGNIIQVPQQTLRDFVDGYSRVTKLKEGIDSKPIGEYLVMW